jgi:hypothetical protein
MQDELLAELLGQDEIERRLTEELDEGETRIARLTGVAGSGKSQIARRVAKTWRDRDDVCIVAVGDDDHSWRELFPLLSGLSHAHRDWVDLASTGTRTAVRVADAAAGGGGVGTSIFDLLTATFRQRTERALKPYSAIERDVLLDLKRLARRRRLLLVADNAHWWDAQSLCLIGDVISERLSETLPWLDKVSVLLVDTEEEQKVAAPEAFARLATSCTGHTHEMKRCTREQFPEVLRLLGASADLPAEILAELFSATHGHLKLAEQIAAYQREADLTDLRGAFDGDYLATLVSARFASLGSFSPEVSDVLVRAAVLGLSCTEKDLRCISDRRQAELRELVRQAETIGFVERIEEEIAFSHDVIRTAILNEQGASMLEDLNLKLAQCLSILRPGDYGARAQALLRGGDRERAREMVALAGVAQVRRGVPGSRMIHQATVEFPDDKFLLDYLQTIAKGYAAIAAGEFTREPRGLRVPHTSETTAMAAERNYLAAIYWLGRQTIAGADEARRILAAWAPRLQGEMELELRCYVLLQQAQVLSERFEEAQETELLLEQRLSKRARHDTDAAAMIQIQNRRAGGIMQPEFALERIEESATFFRNRTDDPTSDALELFRSLTNLAAIETRLGENEKAYGHALEAESIAVEALDGTHRLDVLANNLILAGYRSGTIDLEQTIDRQSLIVHSPGGSEDNFLERCNLAAYLLLAERDAEAAAEISQLDDEVAKNGVDETYLVYYWSALRVGSEVVAGNLEEARRQHAEMEPYVRSLKWPSASYIHRRQQMLEVAIPGLEADSPREELDRVLLADGLDHVGPAWSYYARLFPCCELSFWADS